MKKAQSEIRHALAGQGRVHEAALGDVVYLRAVIKEILRLHPPIPLAPRVCLDDDSKVQGYDVPKGTPVILNLWAISRDPRYWEDSEKFVPERFEGEHTSNLLGLDFEFIPFGAGRRICPGITFSQANIEIALASLLYLFDWELPIGVKPDDIDMADFFGVSVRRKARLLLHPIPRIFDQ
jgi:cytochrome P450